jgi:cysteine desulfurase
MRTYLDHAATTPLDRRVLDAMTAVWESGVGNAGSVHRAGRRARSMLLHATEEMAHAVGCAPDDIVWTSGGTESDHTAIYGIAALSTRRVIVTTAIEHAAVWTPCRMLERQGYEVRILPVDATGRLCEDYWRTAIDDRVALVSVMAANHEVGTIQDVAAIAAHARACGAAVHVDAVQACGHMELPWAHIDAMSISAHKMHGPIGIGALIVRAATSIAPMFHGGTIQRLRSGTMPVALIVGCATAARIAIAELPMWTEHMRALRARMIDVLTAHLGAEDVLFFGHEHGVPHILSVCFPGIDADVLVMRLDMEGIAVSRGAACAAGASLPSHVLLAMGCTPTQLRGTVRVAFGKDNDLDSVDDAARTMARIVREQKST